MLSITLVLATETEASVRGQQCGSILGCPSIRANRVDARIINHESKRVITLEMSCPWVTNREKKEEEKTTKYGPHRWELKQNYQGYEVDQYNIIMDVLGAWCRDLKVKLKEVVRS